MEGMWTKFSPAFLDLTALVRSGRIGEVRSVQASFGASFPRETGSRWSAELGGSALLDQGIYTVMLARAMLGEPLRVSAHGTFFAPGVDESEWVTLEHANGAVSQLASSMVQWIDPSASANGTDGYIRVNAPFWATTSIDIHTGSAEDILFRAEHRSYEIEGNGFVPMIRSVAGALLEGRRESDVHPLRETLAGFEVLDSIRAAIRGV